MMFITVGTTPFPFLRMVDLVRCLVNRRKNNERVIFQCGNTPCNIKEKNVFIYNYLSFQKVTLYMKLARLIVTHGGPATIYQAMTMGKIPHVLPREKKYKEHVNNHQVEFCNYIKYKEKIYIIRSSNSIVLKDNRVTRRRFVPKELLSYLGSITRS